MGQHMHERRFSGGVDRLRAPERIALLKVKKTVELSLENINAGSMLDVGTGSGLFAGEFAQRGLNIAGIDVSDEMIESARKYVPSGNFKKAPAEELPFPDSSFDLVFMGVVLHEADDLGKALSEAHRVAKKRVAVLEWPYSDGNFGPPLGHRIQPETLDILVKNAGFKGYEKTALGEVELFRLQV
jgi:ubiquinone/menaquinone biosynthesis C-methylase UbiE